VLTTGNTDNAGSCGSSLLETVTGADLRSVLQAMFLWLPPSSARQDAIAEIHFLPPAQRNYERVFEGDFQASFDEVDHAALVDSVRRRISGKRVLRLIKVFLRAGILLEDRQARATITGTPQGRILSLILANIALSTLG